MPPARFPYLHPADPSIPRTPLPDVFVPSGRAMPEASRHSEEAGQSRVEQTLGEIGGAVRTAISVEPRDGCLCVFMPPVERIEDYLELIAAAENAAAELSGLPVHIEGYSPPQDERINVIRVAPDPASSRSTSTRPPTGRTAWRSPAPSTRKRAVSSAPTSS